MKIMNKILICGTGPAAVQIAVNIKDNIGCELGIAGRTSSRSESFFSELEKNNNTLCVNVQNINHKKLSGKCSIDQFFRDYQMVTGKWDTIILAITDDAYIRVIKQIDNFVMKNVRYIILVTPAIGSNMLVQNYLKQSGYVAEVISLSTYYAASKRCGAGIVVSTEGVKRKVFIGSTNQVSEVCQTLSKLFKQLGINAEITNNTYEAESRNISIYVHPPIFMNEYALDFIFGENITLKYAYKFYPEGLITQYVIHDLLEQWKEISSVLASFNVRQFNLLRFLNDDNYPVSTQSLSRNDIEDFLTFNSLKQEYLIYIRYTSLLVDPFSEPDKDGRYFDFSAFPIQRAYQDNKNIWFAPRIPKEEYYRLKLLKGLAKKTNSHVPTIDKFLNNYETKLQQFKQTHINSCFSDDFLVQDFNEEIELIYGTV